MADLKTSIQGATRRSLAAMDSMRVSATYLSVSTTSGSTGYNPTTGAATRAGNEHPVKVLLTSFRDTEVDGDIIRPTDQRATLSASEVSFEPKLADRIKIGTVEHEIVRIKREPSQSVYILHIRQT